ncbi:hypothetical protein AGDE_12710 [Angomonas deanei]|nr:hypothetical protein AGDE_12710 [Angomonas deanei]|eukprot:EPY23818.1 hypothetical protein AGDE_12710 [Angomonas deanei]
MAIAFAKSLTDSVLPVPAGPPGAPPRLKVRAWVSVMKHRSVSGVITSRPFNPMYSNPYVEAARTLLNHARVDALLPVET